MAIRVLDTVIQAVLRRVTLFFRTGFDLRRWSNPVKNRKGLFGGVGLVASLVVAGCSTASAPTAPIITSSPTGLSVALQTLAASDPTATAVQFVLRPSSTPLPTATPFTSASNNNFGPGGFPSNINPLSGQKVDDRARLERRPMAIKVTNFPRSVRPQWGLSRADHVYEYYLEDFMTRFVGIFYGHDASRVGPVRSGRFFDEHLIRMYKAILTFAYADDRVIDAWEASDFKSFLVIERPDNCPPLCRIGPEYAYNTLFADTSQLSQYVTQRGTNNERQDLNGLRFEPLPLYSANRASSIAIRFSMVSYHRWSYDANSQRYLRFQDVRDAQSGEEEYDPIYDQLTGEQLAADNLVILFVPYEQAIESSDTEMYQMYLFGEGTAYAFRDGAEYSLVWQRNYQDALLSLKYPNGRDFGLKPGNTWFEVVGQTTTAEQGAEGDWRFVFAIP